MNPATVTAPGAAAKDGQAITMAVPFTRATFEHEEQFLDRTFVPGAGAVQVGPEPVAPYGYMANLELIVETVGTAGAATFRPDAPWCYISDLVLQDVNGAPIFGPMSGYDAYLTNKWGGYDFFSDPAQLPSYTMSTANGSIRYKLTIPVRLPGRDDLGLLPNMNSAATYQLRATIAPNSAVYATGPVTAPTGLRIQAWLDARAQPPATDRQGAPQAVQPPALGTTQYWSKTTLPVLLGNNTHRLTRMGNLLRNVILVYRDATGARSDAIAPDPFRWMFDGNEVLNRSKLRWQDTMRRRGAQALDAGVYLLDFTHDFDGGLGAEMRDLWWPTEQSSKFDIIGISSAAGTLDVLTNDVATTSAPFVR
jgi:hypothetical protein